MTAASIAVAASADARRGVALMLLTMLLFSAMDLMVKHLVTLYPVPQVAWGRFFFHAVLWAAVLAPRLPVIVRTSRPGLQLARSGLLMVTTLLFFATVIYLPLADATAIMQCAPLIVTALSMPLLGERVGVRRWLGVAIGFTGALTIIRPGSGAMHLAAILPLIGAVTFANYQIVTRILSRTDATLTTLFYTPLVGAIAMTALLPFVWVPPDAEGWALMALVGLTGGAGHFTLIRALTLAPAATVSPFGYSGLIWATLFGFLFFGDFPDGWTILGALVVAGSGLYILHRENVKKRTDRG